MTMDMTQLKEKAKQLGIRAGKMKKAEVVRAIQFRHGKGVLQSTGLRLAQGVSALAEAGKGL